MVKGTSKQVIVVRQSDTGIFEQAIFILKDKIHEKGGVSDADILKQAQEAAGAYIQTKVRENNPYSKIINALAYMSAGGGLVGAVWMVTALLV